MKKLILISTVIQIMLGCGSQYPEHNFVQSPDQPSVITDNMPIQHYGSKSVAEIKHDLAQKIGKSTSANIQPPPPVQSLKSKPIQPPKEKTQITVQKKSKSVEEIKQSLQQSSIPAPQVQAKTTPLPIAEMKQTLQKNAVASAKEERAIALPMPHVKNSPPPIAQMKQALQENTVTRTKEESAVVLPMPHVKNSPPPIAQMKQVLQENTVTRTKEDSAVSLPMPHVKNSPPPIAQMKQALQENTVTRTKEESTVALPMPHVKNSPPPIAQMKQIIQQNPISNNQEHAISLPTPAAHTNSPSIATIKDFIQDQPNHSEKKSDKTVVIIQPNAKDGKPKAALKITNARSKIIASGKKLIGTPYLFGGSSRSGFDCSGLVQYVYKQHGINIPRTSRHQFSELKSVNQPQPGDLVFFRHGNRPVNHVGLYIGDNKMLHAPSTGDKVKIVDITSKYWQKRYAGARRVLDNNHLK